VLASRGVRRHPTCHILIGRASAFWRVPLVRTSLVAATLPHSFFKSLPKLVASRKLSIIISTACARGRGYRIKKKGWDACSLAAAMNVCLHVCVCAWRVRVAR
jgi:hypothetical protein